VNGYGKYVPLGVTHFAMTVLFYEPFALYVSP